jgi:preprotein translocase subunit YajC
MSKLFYCTSCKRVINNEQCCEYCKCEEINELAVGAPVNVIGNKLKGKVLKIKDGIVRIIIRDASKNKLVKEYEASKLTKVL